MWREQWRLGRRPDLAGAAIIIGAPVESLIALHMIPTSLTATGVGAGALLLGRRRFPLPAALGALAVIDAGAVLAAPVQWTSDILILASLVAAWTLGRELPLTAAGAAGAFGLLLVGLNVALAPATAHVNAEVAVASEVGCWLAGVGFRRWSSQAREMESRTEEAQSGADAAARRAVADERSRLARELHDIVSHSVTVMTLQAGGASVSRRK